METDDDYRPTEDEIRLRSDAIVAMKAIGMTERFVRSVMLHGCPTPERILRDIRSGKPKKQLQALYAVFIEKEIERVKRNRRVARRPRKHR